MKTFLLPCLLSTFLLACSPSAKPVQAIPEDTEKTLCEEQGGVWSEQEDIYDDGTTDFFFLCVPKNELQQ